MLGIQLELVNKVFAKMTEKQLTAIFECMSNLQQGTEKILD